MAKLNDTGVYQLANKNWAFRYTITTDGRKKDVRKAKDEFGNPLKTKTEAIRARNKALEQEREGRKPAPKARKTVKEVYAEFCENGREDRAYRTKQKQDCLWENHLKGRFGKRVRDVKGNPMKTKQEAILARSDERKSRATIPCDCLMDTASPENQIFVLIADMVGRAFFVTVLHKGRQGFLAD